MRHIAIVGLLLAMASAGAPSIALAAGHDGHWSVLVVTEKGACDRAYRYEVNVADGRLSFAGDPGVNVAGTVASNGIVKVSITGGSRTALGTGRLSSASGVGTWQGAGQAGACGGRWEAERR